MSETVVAAPEGLEVIHRRRSVARLVEPAPDEAELQLLLEAAVTAPDHGQLRPWRFVVVRGDGRARLGRVLADAHAAREPDADAGALEKTAAKPLRAPLVVAVICRPVAPADAPAGKDVAVWEQEAAVAAATTTLCLAAAARGWGSMWRTGWFGDAPEVREALDMGADERVVGWVYLGTAPEGATLPPRRPTDLDAVVDVWSA